MDRLRDAWHNDVMLSMLSAFCVGLGFGVSLLALFVPRWAAAPLAICLALFWSGKTLLDRADRLRAARWERREWR